MSSPQTVPLTWNGYVTQIGNMTVMETTTNGGIVVGVDPEFNVLLPQAVNYAELRIQRDLDFLQSQTTVNYSLTSGNNQLTIDVDDFVTVQTMTLGNGAVLNPVAKEFLQNVYGAGSTTGLPQYFAMFGGNANGGNTSTYIIVGPWPDQNYPVTVYGTQRLPSLYQNALDPALAGTALTFISTYMADLLLQASMIFVAQYQRNFGAASNDPAMGPTYELQYQNLLKGAIVEEARKKFSASAWTSMSPPVAASPTR